MHNLIISSYFLLIGKTIKFVISNCNRGGCDNMCEGFSWNFLSLMQCTGMWICTTRETGSTAQQTLVEAGGVKQISNMWRVSGDMRKQASVNNSNWNPNKEFDAVSCRMCRGLWIDLVSVVLWIVLTVQIKAFALNKTLTLWHFFLKVFQSFH